jgi:hypothetical protein
LREWRARRKVERPDEAREANKRAYEKLKANPEKYRAHAQRVRAAYVPKPRAKKAELTEEQRIVRRQRIAETKKAYWENNPERYQEHLRKCAERNRRLRRAGLAVEVPAKD